MCVDFRNTHSFVSAKKGNETGGGGNKLNATKKGLFWWALSPLAELIAEENEFKHVDLITVKTLQSFAKLIEERSARCILLRGLLSSLQLILPVLIFWFLP